MAVLKSWLSRSVTLLFRFLLGSSLTLQPLQVNPRACYRLAVVPYEI
ncbi:DIABLO isoform 7 [Pongo abelii]|uniref:DIABLO isoform 7 n=1 Tax=Pongo abelii TaxID=9601 RepID=A0A2J8XJM1_PONAB|nr:DIABLO isoform 7 [Pongo abelii]